MTFFFTSTAHVADDVNDMCDTSLLAPGAKRFFIFDLHRALNDLFVVICCVVSLFWFSVQTNLQKMNQRRVSCVKFLGELYNYRLVESRVIFCTLYSFITFGNNQEGENDQRHS